MIPRRQPAGKLLAPKEFGIDLAPDSLLGFLQCGGDLSQANVADDEQVDVTGGHFLRARDRSKNKRYLDPVDNGRQGITQQIDEASSFGEKAAQFQEDWTFLIRLYEDHSALATAFENADIDQFNQFALQA
jgi:hypothetical protein